MKINRKIESFRFIPYYILCLSEGAFAINLLGLRRDLKTLFDYDELITTFDGQKLTKMDTNMRKSITPAEKLAVNLR